MPETLMTVDDLAAFLNVAKHTIYQWRYLDKNAPTSTSNRHGPPGFRVGGQIRYRRSDVEAWLAQKADENSSDAA